MKKNILGLLVFICYLPSASFAWNYCSPNNLPSVISSASCQKVNEGGRVDIDCSVGFNFDDAKKQYNIAIYARKNGQVVHISEHEQWVGNDSAYYAVVEGISSSSQYDLQFLIELKNGNTFYKSSWLQCN